MESSDISVQEMRPLDQWKLKAVAMRPLLLPALSRHDVELLFFLGDPWRREFMAVSRALPQALAANKGTQNKFSAETSQLKDSAAGSPDVQQSLSEEEDRLPS